MIASGQVLQSEACRHSPRSEARLSTVGDVDEMASPRVSYPVSLEFLRLVTLYRLGQSWEIHAQGLDIQLFMIAYARYN